jgi:hypothetical protein
MQMMHHHAHHDASHVTPSEGEEDAMSDDVRCVPCHQLPPSCTHACCACCMHACIHFMLTASHLFSTFLILALPHLLTSSHFTSH